MLTINPLKNLLRQGNPVYGLSGPDVLREGA